MALANPGDQNLTNPTPTNPVIRHQSSATYNIFNLVPDKMERSNYLYWKNQFECALCVHRLLKYISGTEPTSARRIGDVPNPEFEEWSH